MISKRAGGCRCGAIRYEIAGKPVVGIACHWGQALSGYELRVQRLADLREERRKANEEAERQERLRIEQEKRAQAQQLFQEAKNMRRAREIRDYVSAVQAATRDHIGHAERVAEWSSWAMQLANQIDPLQDARLSNKFNAEETKA